MPDTADHAPLPQPQPQPPSPQPVTVIGEVTSAARTFGGMSAQAMNNVVLIALAGIVGLLIYIDRRDRNDSASKERQDRAEQTQMILRHNESQSELNRQVIISQNSTLQSLSMQIGKLENVVQSLDRSVNQLREERKKQPEEEEETCCVVGTAPPPRLKGSVP